MRVSIVLFFTAFCWMVSCSDGDSHSVKPTLDLKDKTDLYLEVGENFSETGYTALDSEGVSLETRVVADYSELNVWSSGEYTIYYHVYDHYGNVSEVVTRNVIVRDSYNPVITILGENPIVITVGNSYSDAGATAVGAVSGTAVEVTSDDSQVDLTQPGTCEVVYTAGDSIGSSTATRSVIVVFPHTPLLEISGDGESAETLFEFEQNPALTGSDPVVVREYLLKADPSCTAYNHRDGNISHRVNIAYPEALIAAFVNGVYDETVYTVEYTLVDSTGGIATPVTRYVTLVPDTTAPVLQLIGPGLIHLEVDVRIDNFADYAFYQTESNAVKATDNVSLVDDITLTREDDALEDALSLIERGTGTPAGLFDLNDQSKNLYTVIYTAEDQAGNSSTITRYFEIVDTTAPVIATSGYAIQYNSDKSLYPGPEFSDNSGLVGYSNPILGGGFHLIDTYIAGLYQASYGISDMAGNYCSEIIEVQVENPSDALLPGLQNGDFELTTRHIGCDEGNLYDIQGWSPSFYIWVKNPFSDSWTIDSFPYDYHVNMIVGVAEPEGSKVFYLAKQKNCGTSVWISDIQGTITQSVSGFIPGLTYCLKYDLKSWGSDLNYDLTTTLTSSTVGQNLSLDGEENTVELKVNSADYYNNWETYSISLLPSSDGTVEIEFFKASVGGDTKGLYLDNVKFIFEQWPYRQINGDDSVTVGTMNALGLFTPN